jgi:hypothetical protein
MGFPCNTGWAHAASNTMSIGYTNQARTFKNASASYIFSPQQLLDCTSNSNYLSNGCEGGSVLNSWKYYRDYGVAINSVYPFVSEQQACETGKSSVFNVSGCVLVPSSSESALRNAVVVSPVAVQINGDGIGFLSYSGGIYDGTVFDGTSFVADCDDSTMNHALSVFAFDYEIDFDAYGQPYNATYWKAFNSFGTDWGDNGNIYIKREEDDTTLGVCGMYLIPSYPTF